MLLPFSTINSALSPYSFSFYFCQLNFLIHMLNTVKRIHAHLSNRPQITMDYRMLVEQGKERIRKLRATGK